MHKNYKGDLSLVYLWANPGISSSSNFSTIQKHPSDAIQVSNLYLDILFITCHKNKQMELSLKDWFIDWHKDIIQHWNLHSYQCWKWNWQIHEKMEYDQMLQQHQPLYSSARPQMQETSGN